MNWQRCQPPVSSKVFSRMCAAYRYVAALVCRIVWLLRTLLLGLWASRWGICDELRRRAAARPESSLRIKSPVLHMQRSNSTYWKWSNVLLLVLWFLCLADLFWSCIVVAAVVYCLPISSSRESVWLVRWMCNKYPYVWNVTRAHCSAI